MGTDRSIPHSSLPGTRPIVGNRHPRWTGTLALLAALLLSLFGSALAAPARNAHAAALAVRTNPNNLAVKYADSHWNWDKWDPNSHGTVNAGSWQSNFQCAEFVARALSTEGVFPGLGPFSPQSSYDYYTALNGTTYRLLYVGEDLPNLYQYLIDTGYGIEVGNHPEKASPGDAVFYYGSGYPSRVHTTLVTQAGNTINGTDTLVDSHNQAQLHFPYNDFVDVQASIVHIQFPNSYAAAFQSLADSISATPYVSAEVNFSGPLNGTLRARSSSVGPWEIFIVVGMDNGQVAFLSTANGMYVSTELSYASPTTALLRARSSTAGPWEKYIIHRSNYSIESTANHLCVASELGGTAYTGNNHGILRARTNCNAIGEWEGFSVINRSMP